MSLVAKGLFPDLGAPSLSYSRPQQGLPSRIGVWQEQKAPSQPPVNSTRRDLLQFTKGTLVTTGMPYASAKIRSQSWTLQTVPPNQQFPPPCTVIKSETFRGPRGVSKVESQRLVLSEITSRPEVLKRLQRPPQSLDCQTSHSMSTLLFFLTN